MRRSDAVGYCLAKPGAYPDNPWGEPGDDDHYVAKVGGKIFAFFGDDAGPFLLTVRSTRERTLEWRARYPQHIGPGPYLKKDLWSRVETDGVPDDEVRELIDDSYDIIVSGLPRRLRP